MNGSTARGLVAALAGLSLALGAGLAAAETVLITGANSGIGLEFATQYAAMDWTVIATHRRREVPETLASLKAEYPKVVIETLDVTSVEQARALDVEL